METDDFYYSVAEVLRRARAQAYRAVNFAMVEAYWNVGRMIVEEEQQGEERAEYGVFLIGELSRRLMKEFGRGFSEPSLWNMRQFYQYFPILSALRRELTWTHYKSLIRVENQKARNWYMKEAAEQKWSTRALQRQINSFYYERMLLSSDREAVKSEMLENKTPRVPNAEDLIKDPWQRCRRQPNCGTNSVCRKRSHHR